MPPAYRCDQHLFTAKVDDIAFAGDEGAGRGSVRRSVLASHLIEHQLGVVLELDGKPVPTLLTLAKLRAAELMIHPGDAVTGCAVHATGDFESRHRVVVRCVSNTFGLHADAVLSVHSRRFSRRDHEIDGVLAP